MKSEIIDLVLTTLNQMGVILTNMKVEGQDAPTFFVQIIEESLIQSLEDTLKSTYGILWSFTYGKVKKSNRDSKINLNYQLLRKGVVVQ